MLNILVVDDEIDILETIVDTLEIEFDPSKVTIAQAINGVEALALFNNGEQVFDLVVTDLNMPEMDGIELTQKLKEIRSDLSVIVFTGHGDLEENHKLEELGVLAMIKKPYVEELVQTVIKSIPQT